jgi:hypothetical protein
MAGRKIRNERDARRCLAAARAAGLSRSEWARQQGIDGRSLFGWSKKLERSDKFRGTKKKRRKRKNRSGLVELVPGASSAGSRYVVRCGQLTVEVDDRFDEATLARLLKVIVAC